MGTQARMSTNLLPVALLCATAWAAPIQAQQQQTQEEVTDSVMGHFVSLGNDSTFVIRTDDGQELTFEIASDVVQEESEEEAETVNDTTVTSMSNPSVAHTSRMSFDDLVMALEQVQQSDASDLVHLHYIVEGVPERRVAIWIAVGEP
jgi:hypothetical protein